LTCASDPYSKRCGVLSKDSQELTLACRRSILTRQRSVTRTVQKPHSVELLLQCQASLRVKSRASSDAKAVGMPFAPRMKHMGFRRPRVPVSNRAVTRHHETRQCVAQVPTKCQAAVEKMGRMARGEVRIASGTGCLASGACEMWICPLQQCGAWVSAGWRTESGFALKTKFSSHRIPSMVSGGVPRSIEEVVGLREYKHLE